MVSYIIKPLGAKPAMPRGMEEGGWGGGCGGGGGGGGVPKSYIAKDHSKIFSETMRPIANRLNM